jgi:TRAP-type C4-dicarboxylate transport system substrate-binding protein
MKKKLTVRVLYLFLVGSVIAGCADLFGPDADGDGDSGSDDGQTLVRFASEEIEGDFMTFWAEEFAVHIEDWSGGAVAIDVYPYGTLPETEWDIVALAQAGTVEYAFADYAWASAHIPEASVFGLHYLWPDERVGEVMDWIIRNGDTMGILEQSFRREGLVPLTIMFEGWQWITSNDEITGFADLEDFQVRIMGSADSMLHDQYTKLGASPVSLPYGDIYSALENNEIDGQVNPLFAIRSMEFYEQQDYFTQIYAEPFVAIPIVNADYFDSLSPSEQEEHRRWWTNAIISAEAWIDTRNENDLNSMLSDRPQMEVNELSGTQLDDFRGAATDSYSVFLDEKGGPNAQEIYDALTSDIEDAKEALNMN